jgi:peptidoglycan/LPS O-acetylase OafA/YrhL
MRRIAELDGLRGAAAVLIVAYHLFKDYPPGFWAAVDLFFVLSGYLITAIVLRHACSWRFLLAFYARRGLRIWPIYYLVILILVLGVGRRGDLVALPYYLTYTQQLPHYWGGAMPDWPEMGHTWTLALEEQFYLIWPALVLLGGRRWTCLLASALAIAALEARVAGAYWWVLAGRCDGFALGGLLAAILAGPDADRARRSARSWAVVLGALAILLCAGLAATGRLMVAGGTVTTPLRVTIASLGSFALVALVVCHAGHPLLAPLRTRLLVYLGTISYGIYLYHYLIIKLCAAVGNSWNLGTGPALWLTEIVLTLAAAVTSWHLIERPILRIKDRFQYERDATPERIEEPTSAAFGPHRLQPAGRMFRHCGRLNDGRGRAIIDS